MSSSRNRNSPDDLRFWSTEAVGPVTILRFHPGSIWAGIDLQRASTLWEFFERAVAGPGRVLLISFAPGDLSQDALTRLNERAQHMIAEEYTRDGCAYAARMELTREDNAIHRSLSYGRDGRLFVIGASQGEIDIHLLGLLLACDFRVVSEDSTIVNNGYPRSLTPSTGVPWFLTRIMGRSQALEILLDCDILSARRACELGIVHRITRADSHERDSLALAQAIAAKGVQHLLGLKRSLAKSLAPLDEYLETEGACLQRLRIGPPSCGGCGYNLTGNVSGRCPECGRAVDDVASCWAGCIQRAEEC